MTKETQNQNKCDECLKKIKQTIRVVLITALSIIGVAVILFNAIRLKKLEENTKDITQTLEKLNYRIDKLDLAVFNVKE